MSRRQPNVRRTRRNRRPVEYTLLEGRQLLAGDLAVVFRGGNLRLTGDGAANLVRIENAGGDLVRVTGTSTTLNGSTNPFEARGIRQLTIDLKDGDDQITVTGLVISGKLSVKGGDGDDRIELVDTNSRDCAVDPGAGDDTVDINGVQTTRSTGIRLPKGNDVVGINGLTTGRDLSIRGRGTATVITGVLNVGRNLSASFGGGTDQLLISGDTQVGGSSTVRLGKGNDFVGVVPERVGETVNVAARLSVDGGGGDDLVSLDSATGVTAGIRVNGGSGSDTVQDVNGTATTRLVESTTTNQPNPEYRAVMSAMTGRGLDTVPYGDVRLVVDPADQFVKVDDRSPTISVRWDDAAVQAIAARRTGPTVAARAFGMVHTAMYDAWSVYDLAARSTLAADDFQRPSSENTVANKQTAMSFAAYRVLVDLFPDQVEAFNALMGQLGLDPANQSTDTSTAAGIGNVMATRLLEFRHADGSNQLGTDPEGTAGTPYSDISDYVATNGPDQVVDLQKWTPERVPIDADPGTEIRIQKYLTPHWGNVTPFALTSGSQFRAPLPEQFLLVSDATVDLQARTITLADSTVLTIDRSLIGTVINPEFVAQFEEIVTTSAGLTDQQKMIAEFWEDGAGTAFPPGTWMTFGEYVSARDNHSLDDDARMFFALGNAVLDAGIATWETKRFYDYARPVRTVRELGRLGLIGEFDAALGGFAIDAWKPGEGTRRILATDFLTYQTPGGDPSPPFPDYTSGHSAFSASAAEVLRQFTGSDEFGGFVSLLPGQSRFEPGITPTGTVTLSWPTFTAAALEAGLSRVFGGIHFGDANREGTALGTQVGVAVWNRASQLFSGQA